jgi:hypothetical protein
MVRVSPQVPYTPKAILVKKKKKLMSALRCPKKKKIKLKRER